MKHTSRLVNTRSCTQSTNSRKSWAVLFWPETQRSRAEVQVIIRELCTGRCACFAGQALLPGTETLLTTEVTPIRNEARKGSQADTSFPPSYPLCHAYTIVRSQCARGPKRLRQRRQTPKRQVFHAPTYLLCHAHRPRRGKYRNIGIKKEEIAKETRSKRESDGTKTRMCLSAEDRMK